jgi:hypothetical protein
MTADQNEIQAKVSRAAVLIGQGMSVNRASKEVGLPRTSLIRYLKRREDDKGVDHHGTAPAQAGSRSSDQPFNRDDRGRFLPGNSFGTGGLSAETRQARKLLEEFSPRAARKLIQVFRKLPDDQPQLLLAFGKEILDRALGRPRQSVEVSGDLDLEGEYSILQERLLSSPEAIRHAAALAQLLEGNSGQPGRAPEQGQMDSGQTPL